MATTSEHEVKQKADDLYRSTMDYLVSKKDDMHQSISDQVDALDARVAQWKQDACEVKGETSASIQRESEELERKTERFKHQLEIYRSTTASAAADAKKGLEDAATDLRDGLRRAGEHFRN